LGVAKIL
jgi:NIMA (never in mitosis gene a)-related kinase 1/4/5